MKRGKIELTARIGPDGRRVRLRGRQAQTCSALVRRGTQGVSAWDFPGGPAYRLAAYIHELRRVGFSIQLDWEPHDGGRHGRFRLTSPVTIEPTD